MAELKTKRNDASVVAFLDSIPDEQRRKDCRTVLKMMKEATGAPPRMWGKDIVGLGDYHYRYASGREGDWFLMGFSPRKQDLTLYLMAGYERYPELMRKLGKHKTGKSCLYLKRLADVDVTVLTQLISASVKQMARPR